MLPSVSLRPEAAQTLDVLYQHRLLCTRQLREIVLPANSPRWMNRLLAALTAQDLVASIRARRPGPGRAHRLWYLTQLGAEVVEAAPNRAEPRRRLLSPAQAAGQLQAHTLAVNDVAIAFLRAARRRGHDFGPYSWRHEVAHDLGRTGRRARGALIPDAVLRYWMTEPEGRTIPRYRFVELDRANLVVDDVVGKLVRYAGLYRLWQERMAVGQDPSDGMPDWPLLYRAFPTVIVVLANPDRANLRRRMANMIALCRTDPAIRTGDGISVSFVFHHELVAQGPFAPIFRRLEDERWVDWLGREAEPQPVSDAAEVMAA
jgi:hypothetical protein